MMSLPNEKKNEEKKSAACYIFFPFREQVSQNPKRKKPLCAKSDF